MVTSKAIMNKKKWLSLELNSGVLIMLSTSNMLTREASSTFP